MATPTNNSTTPIWLISGASSGFGHAISQEALSRGHRVIATARSHSKLSSLEALGASVLSLDVTSPEADLAAIIKEAASIYGAITHVANCAGYILEGAVEESSQKEVHDVFNTNVFGTVNLARAVIPYLREAAEHGYKPALATFGSLGSWRSGAAVSLYCSTKFAVTGLTEGLYEELKPFGISVCCVEPGYTRTGFLSTTQDGGDHRMKTARQLDVYQNTAAASARDALNAYSWQQPGDVKKCATAIVDVLTREKMAEGEDVVPMRLVLGSDCLETVRTKCETTLKLVKEWEGVTVSADGVRGAVPN
ncbi:putative oxidoreductase YusZ [Cladorrhinum sp. PSN332]|nr:putative oxidoreductase YusZ [Cladorrhinum sp. PSN332]